jgi:hypothetical protein
MKKQEANRQTTTDTKVWGKKRIHERRQDEQKITFFFLLFFFILWLIFFCHFYVFYNWFLPINCASSKVMNESKLNTLQQIKRSLSENELNVYAKCNTLTDGSGWKEIDLNMSPDPALQIVTSKIKSLGEVFITTCQHV